MLCIPSEDIMKLTIGLKYHREFCENSKLDDLPADLHLHETEARCLLLAGDHLDRSKMQIPMK